MMKHILLSATLLMSFGCATTTPDTSKTKTISQPKKQAQTQPESVLVQRPGYSFKLANGAGWGKIRNDKAVLIIAKRGATPYETLIIQAQLFKLKPYSDGASFKKLIDHSIQTELHSDSSKVLDLTSNFETFKNTDCVVTRAIKEFDQPEKDSAVTLNLETYSLSCALPKNRDFGINVAYSRKALPSNTDNTFPARASKLLRSVEFPPVKIQSQ